MKNIIRLATLSLISIWPMVAQADDTGRAGLDVLVGVPVFQHRFAAFEKQPLTLTLADTVRLSQQVGINFNVADGMRLGISAQLIEALTQPEQQPYPSRLTGIQIQPGASFKLFDSFWLGFDAVFATRVDGINQFGFAVQPNVRAQTEIGGGFSLLLAVQVPVYVIPDLSVGITPFLGIMYQDPVAQ